MKHASRIPPLSTTLRRSLCGFGTAGLLLAPTAALAVDEDLFCSVDAPVFADHKVYVKKHSAIRGENDGLTHVMSNGKVKLHKHAMIDGHLTAAHVKTKRGSTVTGNVLEMAAGIVPDDPTDLVASFEFNNDNHHLPQTEMGNDALDGLDLKLDKGDRLVMPAGDYYLHKLEVGKNSVLEVTGPVRIFMPDGKVKFKYGSLVGAAETDVTIVIAGKGHLKVGGHSGFHAAVYAPESKFELKGEGVASGSLVVDKLKVDKGAQYHSVDVCVEGPPDLVPIPNEAPPNDIWPPELVIIDDPWG